MEPLNGTSVLCEGAMWRGFQASLGLGFSTCRSPLGTHVVVSISISKGTLIWTPKYYNPHFMDPQKSTPIVMLGNPQVERGTRINERTERVAAKDFVRITWGFPKIRGTFLGVPIIRTIVYWGLYWGPLI